MNNNNRKHYRVYTRKNSNKDSSNSMQSMIDMNNHKFIFGMIGLAFIKGLLCGYVLKDICHKRR